MIFMKKAIVLLALLFIVTGCSKTPELKYEGKDIVYFCTKEDIKLFESKVNVLLNQDQGFLSIEDGKWHEKINHEEDVKLANEGIVKTKITSGVNTHLAENNTITNGGSINLLNKSFIAGLTYNLKIYKDWFIVPMSSSIF